MIVNDKLSPSFFPMVIGCLAVVLSLILTWRSLKSTGQLMVSEQPTGVDRYRVVLIIVATAAFILVFQRIGYLLSASAYVLSIIVLFSDRTHIVAKLLMSVAA